MVMNEQRTVHPRNCLKGVLVLLQIHKEQQEELKQNIKLLHDGHAPFIITTMHKLCSYVCI